MVVLRENVNIEIFGGPPATSHECAVRIAIEQIDDVRVLAVTLVRGGSVIAYWPQGQQADVLQIFQLFRFITGLNLKTIKHDYLGQMLTYVREAELPAGPEHKRFRKNVRQAFSAAMAYVPSPNDVAQALIHCREFQIHADTESLSALAAEGKFDVTPTLRDQGVIPGDLYRSRKAKIEEILAGMRQQLDATCSLLGITFDDVAPIARQCVEYGIDSRTVCMQVAVNCFAGMPMMAFRLSSGRGLNATVFVQADPVDQSLEIVTKALRLTERQATEVERDFLGFQCQLRRGSLKKIETNVS